MRKTLLDICKACVKKTEKNNTCLTFNFSCFKQQIIDNFSLKFYMTVKVRLARGGSKKRPFYNIVAIDSRKKRDGKPLEYLGYINPMVEKENAQAKPIHVETEKLLKWVETGAVVSESLAGKLHKFGIKGMEKFIPAKKTEYLGVTKKAKKADFERKEEEAKQLAKAKADKKKAEAAAAAAAQA